MADGFTLAEITALAETFPPARARALLRGAGFPMESIPADPGTAAGFWEQISESLALGIMADGRQRILAEALRRYPASQVFSVAADSRSAAGGQAAQLRVLVIGAAPAGTQRIRPERDAKAIMAAASKGHLLVDHCPAATVHDLARIIDFQPDILHMACHGEGDYLIFEDIHGDEHRVLASDIADTLALYRDLKQVRLDGVVLASCDGNEVAAHFTAAADRVVAHDGLLDEPCAVAFTEELYDALRHTPDLGKAARLAAQQARLIDESCADVTTGLIVLPDV